jgi:peptidoglycan/LPS O-acetylase OafA/YrhL
VVVNWEQIGPTFSLWSIGVEEQFYLLFPLIVFFPMKKKVLLISLIVWFVAYFSFFFANEFLWINLGDKWHRLISFTLRFHFLLWGCVLGYVYYHYKEAITRFLGNYLIQIIVIGAMVYTMLLKTEVQDTYHLKAGLAFSILMLTVTLPNSLIKMDWQPLKYLGVISYGIYIFHPFVSIVVRYAMQKSGSFNTMIEKNHWSFYLIVLAITVIVAHLSYHYYESYFLRKK